jgi:HEAT repeat protein
MTLVQELQNLVGEAQAQAACAIALLKPRQRPDVLLAALQVLEDVAVPEAREPLLDLYKHYAAGGPQRDPGGNMRRAVLDTLRPIAQPADVPLLLDAVSTYEFVPPRFQDDAGPLRASALLVLNDLDDTLPRHHTARMLVDRHAQEMSGEPALTAVRVLDSLYEHIPLYLVAMQAAGSTLPEVVSECLRCLTGIPPAPLLIGSVFLLRMPEYAVH